MELAGLDVQEALKFLLTRDRRVPIRCAWGDFTVKNGVMTSRGLAFDTTDTLIVGEGQVSLRDETLDLKLRREMQLELKRIQIDVGLTFVHVTHDRTEALALADRIAVLDQGALQQLASPERLVTAPANPFVAGFTADGTLLIITVTGVSRVPPGPTHRHRNPAAPRSPRFHPDGIFVTPVTSLHPGHRRGRPRSTAGPAQEAGR